MISPNASYPNKLGFAIIKAFKEGVDLTNADFDYDTNAVWKNVTLTSAPIFITGLDYTVILIENHMQIDREINSIDSWEKFGDKLISRVDKKANFWRDYRDMFLMLARKKYEISKKKI